MESAAPAAAERRFRLRGKVGSAQRSFPLKKGVNTIGRDPGSDVTLDAKGISQKHSKLIVGPNLLRLKDAGSKNGSFVNGARVENALLQPGDRLWFGPIEVVLEEVEDLETRLALELSPEDGWVPPSSDWEETQTQRLWLDTRVVRRWLRVLDVLAQSVDQGKEESLPRLMRIIMSGIGAEGVALLSHEEGLEAVVLAAVGSLDQHLPQMLQPRFRARSAQPENEGRVLLASDASPSGKTIASAMLVRPRGPSPALALIGPLEWREELGQFSAIALRLVEHRLSNPVLNTKPKPANRHDSLVFPSGYVVGISASVRELHSQMRLLASGDLPVLITGETGVGKECVARILHDSSGRRGKPFVAINCAALPADLLEAEMFGIGRGVATGVCEREGRFRQAQGGTLFLDEIADLPEELQPKLLRALQEGEIHPLGMEPVSVDVRILSATNSDLPRLVESGKFRADLYYRLAGAHLEIPPLRRRREDIPMLFEHFLRRCLEEVSRSVRGITVKALTCLTHYSWPGNVRELAHEARRLAFVCPEGEAIESETLTARIRGVPVDAKLPVSPAAGRDSAQPPSLEGWLRETPALRLASIECAVIEEALRRSGGNQVKAGRLLGISRMAVRRRLERCRESRGAAPTESPRRE